MPQQIVKAVGGTVEAYFLDRQVASATAALYTPDGSQRSTGAATVDTVSTTISAQAAALARTLTLTSATGVVSGRRYLVDGVVPEVVTVKDVSGLTVTLTAPLTNRHASAATFKGIRVSYAVASTAVTSTFWDGYCDFTPDSGEPVTEVVDCVLRKIPNPLMDMSDARLIFPKAVEILDAELDLPAAFDQARDGFLMDVGGKFRANAMLGTKHLRDGCAMRFWLDRGPALGDQWAANIAALQSSYDRHIQDLQSQVPVDNDQDGTTNGPNDGGITTIRLERM